MTTAVGRKKIRKVTCWEPPSCCVIAETERGSLGYKRMAVLPDEIGSLGSLSQASKAARIDLDHASELVVYRNESFREPLVEFDKRDAVSDNVLMFD